MIQVKAKNFTIVWNSFLKLRVNNVVIYNDCYFQNVTGMNSEPNTGTRDWIHIGSVNSIEFSNLKIASKGLGNQSKEAEPNDILFGLLDDGTTFIPFGKYLGGGLQNVDNYITNPIEF